MSNHGQPQGILTHDVELDTVADEIYELAVAGEPVPLDKHARAMTLGLNVQEIIDQAEEDTNG